MLECLAVGAGGFVGSIFRYLLGKFPLLTNLTLPAPTLVANFLGAILIGLIVETIESRFGSGNYLTLFLKVGLCGGFTTFSTFANESVNMMQEQPWMSALYIALSIGLCLAGVVIGRYAGSLI